jgi:conjugative transfer pilus assembly protein TraH
MESLKDAREQIQDEYITIAGRYGNPQTLMAFYQSVHRRRLYRHSGGGR